MLDCSRFGTKQLNRQFIPSPGISLSVVFGPLQVAILFPFFFFLFFPFSFLLISCFFFFFEKKSFSFQTSFYCHCLTLVQYVFTSCFFFVVLFICEFSSFLILHLFFICFLLLPFSFHFLPFFILRYLFIFFLPLFRFNFISDTVISHFIGEFASHLCFPLHFIF